MSGMRTCLQTCGNRVRKLCKSRQAAEAAVKPFARQAPGVQPGPRRQPPNPSALQPAPTHPPSAGSHLSLIQAIGPASDANTLPPGLQPAARVQLALQSQVGPRSQEGHHVQAGTCADAIPAAVSEVVQQGTMSVLAEVGRLPSWSPPRAAAMP